MSEKIKADNLDEVVKKNMEIHDDIMKRVFIIHEKWNSMRISSSDQLAMQILKTYGLIQMPLDNRYWSGAIYIKNGRKIPVINTAQPRANQYFTAWHEIYHLIFDQISFNHIIENDIIMEERKAEYFSACMLLGNLQTYYSALPEMNFLSKVFHCMAAFQATYKAVLVALYEGALQNRDTDVLRAVKENFDTTFIDMDERFRMLGLDDSLVKPSYVVNVGALQSKIQIRIKKDPELRYNYTNAMFLEDIVKRINLVMEDKNE